MTLTPLSHYTVPTDGVPMYAACSTRSGRIFLGGADSHVYEVDYGKNGRCRKVKVTQTMLGLLGSVVPRVLTRAQPSAVAALVVDHERHFMYALHQNSSIQARRTLSQCVDLVLSSMATHLRVVSAACAPTRLSCSARQSAAPCV
jgi:Nup133 N terminal like